MYFIKSLYIYIKEEQPAVYGGDKLLDAYALQVKAGEFHFFDNIDHHLRPVIRRMTFKYDMNEHDREDLIQEMVFSALILCLKYDFAKGHYKHYVLRSIRLKMYDYIHRLKVWHQVELNPDETLLLEHQHALRHIMLKETQAEYAGAAGNLSNYEKRALKLFLDGCTIEDIADIFNKEPESVINTFYRIKIKFNSVEDLHTVVDNDALNRYSILELK